MAHDETLTDGAPGEGGHGRGRLLIAGTVVVLVVVALYALASLVLADRVPEDTHVGGVAIGGKTEGEARKALEEGLSDEEAEPITVEVDGTKKTIDPEDAGLAYDYEESLDGLTGFSLNPVDLYNNVAGGVDRDIETTVDEDRLDSALEDATADLDKKPVEGKVSLDGAEVKQTAARPGRTVERDELAGAIADEWPGTRTFTAPTSEAAPKIEQDEIDDFVEGELEPLVSGPVTVATTDPTAKGKKRDISVELDAEQVAAAVDVTTKDGALDADVDDKVLAKTALAEAKVSDSFEPARDAEVTRDGKGYDVAPSRVGFTLDDTGLGQKIAEAMTKKGDERSVDVKTVEDKPEFTTTEARRTLPKEQISTFTTEMPSATEPRADNIRHAAEDLDGTYVPPGETFSLNDELGERSAETGYKEAHVIQGDRLVDDFGGGISQLSTTLFNAVFFSGAKIEEFHPHSFYIERYPEGREATISWPDLDNRFTNDTGAGILIEAEVRGEDVIVSFQGRSKYDEVKATKSERRNVQEPDAVTDDSEECEGQDSAEGFTVDITRDFIKDGKTVKSSSFTTTYSAKDKVTCTGG